MIAGATFYLNKWEMLPSLEDSCYVPEADKGHLICIHIPTRGEVRVPSLIGTHAA